MKIMHYLTVLPLVYSRYVNCINNVWVSQKGQTCCLVNNLELWWSYVMTKLIRHEKCMRLRWFKCFMVALSVFLDWYTTKWNEINLLLLEMFLRCIWTLCVAMRIAPISPIHSTDVINYSVTIHLFRTVLRNRLKNFSSNNKYRDFSVFFISYSFHVCRQRRTFFFHLPSLQEFLV